MKPVKIYELIGNRHQELDQRTQDFLALYKLGRRAYTSRNFEQALKIFTQAQAMQPRDKAVAIHIDRINGYLAAPPPPDWDGVYIMTTK